MGQQVSVETFASSADADGYKYWTSFDPYPFKIGRKKLAYMGILNGDGPLAGQKCVVKTIRDRAISRSDWLLESRRSKVARSLANDYNKRRPEDDQKITFNCPVLAEIDTMSDCLCINDILGKPKKKWEDSECVSIELYLKGRFEEFEFGWVKNSDLWLPEAFSHFSWCRSEGTMLVSNLQGVKTNRAYHLTGPTVHSELKEFGSSDLGHEGIKCFFKYHTCNKICKNWPRLGDGINLSGWGECMNTNFVDRRPSAPAPPPYQNDSPPLYDTHASTNLNPHVNREIVPWPRGEQAVSSSAGMELGPNSSNVTAMSSIQNRLNGNGFILDWRQEFIAQNSLYGGRFGHDNPAFQDPFGMQLLWLVKEMSYAMYASPPPPYCRCVERPRSGISALPIPPKDEEDVDYFSGGNDMKCLLPPAYSEENVDPRSEFVTYL